MELELRPYQEAVIEALRQGFASGHRTQILYAGTGAGKTECSVALLKATADKGNRALFIADRRVLVEQTSERLDRYGIPHGVLMAKHWRYRPHEKIQVCSAQTLERMEAIPDLALLIADEAHRQRRQTIEFIRRNDKIKAIGLTATPFTDGLGLTYENVVSAMTTEQIVREGWLVPLRYFVCREIDMTGARKVAGEWSEADAADRGIKITGDVVATWAQKAHEIYGGPRKTLVFSAGVRHGADLAEKFCAAGFNFVALSYKDDDEFKRQAIDEFRQADSSIVGLIATDILTAGFDVPDAEIAVLARPFSKSLSSHVQQIGRVMRPFPGKEFAVILDHAGNVLRFRDDWEDVYHNGVSSLRDGREKTKREPTEREKDAAKCPKCGCLWPSKADMCSSCGYVRQMRNDVIEQAGDLTELAERVKSKVSKDEKQIWYSSLLYIARSRGYKPGWVGNQYRNRFGVWPRGMQDIATEPPANVASWIKSQQIRYANRRAQ